MIINYKNKPHLVLRILDGIYNISKSKNFNVYETINGNNIVYLEILQGKVFQFYGYVNVDNKCIYITNSGEFLNVEDIIENIEIYGNKI